MSQDLWDRWNSPDPTVQFIGDDGAPNGYVTVEGDWLLHTLANAGAYKRTPVRWWQRADNSQGETEVPNVVSIAIDRALENDASSCTITLRNIKMRDYGAGDPDPGFYTWNYGESPEAAARWGHDQHGWHDVFVPNALLRTYEGYGGRDKTRTEAIEDGNVMLTGVWLVDEVNPASDGTLKLVCRDMAKLLIEQQLYPPLIPERLYPLEYYRWVDHVSEANHGYDTDTGRPDSDHGVVIKRGVYADSSTHNEELTVLALTGQPRPHRAAHAIDRNPSTYWLSEQENDPDDEVFIELDVNEEIDAVFVRPMHNYMCHVSIMVDGEWKTDGGILPSGQTYVKRFGVIKGLYNWYELGGAYRAAKVRFTFTNLRTDANWTGHRAAIYDVAVGSHALVDGRIFVHDIETAPNDRGYVLQGGDGAVFPFGPGARFSGDRRGNIENDGTTGIALTESGNGYWLVGEDGGVFGFGDASFHGSLPLDGITPALGIVEIDSVDDGGYWLFGRDGGVFAYGNAPYQGNATTDRAGAAVVDGVAHPNGQGYYILTNNGGVFAYGPGVTHYGSAFGSGDNWVGIAVRPQGDGYWLVNSVGTVRAFGAAENETPRGEWDEIDVLDDEIFDIAATSTGEGYLLVGGDGGVFAFGDAQFYGSLRGAFDWQTDGNYKDYTEIIRDLLLWSGWWLYDPDYPANGAPAVYGNLESTGIYAESRLPADMFDKKPVIDAINEIKEIVGYLFYIDDEGAARFETPNWWQSGNFYEDGTETDFIPEIDERHNLIDYGVSYNDRNARSEIIIATEDPTADFDDTVTTRIRPPTAALLRGMVRPAMWVNGAFTKKREQKIMAELIALHIWFSMRAGNVTCVANPAIQVNDQVRILERNTSETYVHYVRSVHTEMNLEEGTYTMDLSTNWLGDEREWVITRKDLVNNGVRRVQVSDDLWDWIGRIDSRRVTSFRLSEESGAAA